VTTPWPAMLRLAAGNFRIAPEAFWRLSLKEWQALTDGEAAVALDRAGLEALLGKHPD
jgi:uncharacterized phage protein (TIGR02216 family)